MCMCYVGGGGGGLCTLRGIRVCLLHSSSRYPYNNLATFSVMRDARKMWGVYPYMSMTAHICQPSQVLCTAFVQVPCDVLLWDTYIHVACTMYTCTNNSCMGFTG